MDASPDILNWPAFLIGCAALLVCLSVQGSTVTRKGIASATIDGGKLYLISFVAPAAYFFDRDRPKAEAIMASARF